MSHGRKQRRAAQKFLGSAGPTLERLVEAGASLQALGEALPGFVTQVGGAKETVDEGLAELKALRRELERDRWVLVRLFGLVEAKIGRLTSSPSLEWYIDDLREQYDAEHPQDGS